MLNSFTIENFRLFRQVEFPRLKRVNLLVGKNNSGKSALLEALELYASNASITTLRDLVVDRHETWNERIAIETQWSGEVPLRHLFRGHNLPEIGMPGIVLGPSTGPMKQIQLVTGAFQTVTNEDGTLRRRMLNPSEVSDLQVEDEFEFSLIVQEGEKSRRIIRLDQASYMPTSRLAVEQEPKYPFQVVPTSNMTSQKVAALWDMIGLTSLAEEVISGLKLIDASITGVLFVDSAGRNDARMPLARMPLVSSNNAPEPLPLKSMGDGMTRLFHIIVALVSAKDGLLFIDEFENGLHWSVQLEVWKTVFRLANHLNVQVFATTHSRDCVSGFEGAWLEEPDGGAFFRLQLDVDGSSCVMNYSLDTLADSLETNVEVR